MLPSLLKAHLVMGKCSWAWSWRPCLRMRMSIFHHCLLLQGCHGQGGMHCHWPGIHWLLHYYGAILRWRHIYLLELLELVDDDAPTEGAHHGRGVVHVGTFFLHSTSPILWRVRQPHLNLPSFLAQLSLLTKAPRLNVFRSQEYSLSCSCSFSLKMLL